jgi:hypothetical protein
MYVSIMLFEGWAVQFIKTWPTHPFHAANNVNGIDADADHDGRGIEFYTLQDSQAGKPKQHPIGMTFQYRGGSNQDLLLSHADWVSPHSGEGGEDYLRNPAPSTWCSSPGKPATSASLSAAAATFRSSGRTSTGTRRSPEMRWKAAGTRNSRHRSAARRCCI